MSELNIPIPIPFSVPTPLRVAHFIQWYNAVKHVVFDPPDLNFAVRIPLHVEGFGHLPTKAYTERGPTGKRVRFARHGIIPFMRGGEPFCSNPALQK